VQISSSQVVVQLASTSFGSAGLPVFSISKAVIDPGSVGTVKISALARAMAGIAPTGAAPQLNLAVQLVGSSGGASSLSFTPSAPAAAAAERFAVAARDPGEAARAAAVEQAAQRQAQQATSAEVAPGAQPLAADPVAARSAYTATASATAAASALPAAASSVDISV
jgi:hypothetical protein